MWVWQQFRKLDFSTILFNNPHPQFGSNIKNPPFASERSLGSLHQFGGLHVISSVHLNYVLHNITLLLTLSLLYRFYFNKSLFLLYSINPQWSPKINGLRSCSKAKIKTSFCIAIPRPRLKFSMQDQDEDYAGRRPWYWSCTCSSLKVWCRRDRFSHGTFNECEIERSDENQS